MVLPPPPPLYQRLPGTAPLTREERQSCPSALLIATGNNPIYRLTSADDGVRFDLDADGEAERLAWTQASSSVAFLAIDHDGDGAITSGRELFGEHTWPGVRSGVAALSEMAKDSNGGVSRGHVNSDDPLMARLLLWTDTNHNGVSEPSELRPADEEFSGIGLGYGLEYGLDLYGNRFIFEGWARIRTGPSPNGATSWEDSTQHMRRTYVVCFARSRS